MYFIWALLCFKIWHLKHYVYLLRSLHGSIYRRRVKKNFFPSVFSSYRSCVSDKVAVFTVCRTCVRLFIAIVYWLRIFCFARSTRDATYNKEDGSVRMFLRGRPVVLYAPSSDIATYDITKVATAPSSKLKLDWVYPFVIACPSPVLEVFSVRTVVDFQWIDGIRYCRILFGK